MEIAVWIEVWLSPAKLFSQDRQSVDLVQTEISPTGRHATTALPFGLSRMEHKVSMLIVTIQKTGIYRSRVALVAECKDMMLVDGVADRLVHNNGPE
jgi:hypothetical protein